MRSASIFTSPISLPITANLIPRLLERKMCIRDRYQCLFLRIPLRISALCPADDDTHQLYGCYSPNVESRINDRFVLRPYCCLLYPSDLPEAESELTAGYHTEYSGMHFGDVYKRQVQHGSVKELYHICGMDEEGIYKVLISF